MTKKSIAPIAGVLGVIIVAFNIITFVSAKEFSANFWSGYSFITLSWLCLVIVSLVIGNRKDYTGYGLFLSTPIIVISMIYLLFELIAGIMIMIIADFSFRASIVIQVIIFALYLILLFGLSLYKGMASQKLKERTSEASFIKPFIMQIENAKSRCKNTLLKQKLTEIGDLVKYSDPVSSIATADTEVRINELFSQVSEDLYKEEKTVAVSVCDEIIILLNQRNALCAANKKR